VDDRKRSTGVREPCSSYRPRFADNRQGEHVTSVLVVPSMMKNTYPNLRWNPGFQWLVATHRHDKRKRKKAIESCDRAAFESSWLSDSRTSI
jgi:hypothetical protein